jgi:hypothetical protein
MRGAQKNSTSLSVRDFNSHLIRTKPEPPRIPGDITQTYTARIVNNSVPLKPIAFVDIMPSVPGGTTSWPMARINSVTIRGPAATDNTIVVQSIDDGRIWTDSGTQGSERACVSFRPSLQQRMTWQSTTTLDAQFRFSGPQGTLIYVELVLRTVDLSVYHLEQMFGDLGSQQQEPNQPSVSQTMYLPSDPSVYHPQQLFGEFGSHDPPPVFTISDRTVSQIGPVITTIR